MTIPGAPAATRCRACAADVPAGAIRCPNCGAAQGPLDPCPHCRAQAGVSPHGEFRWVCDVCGGPRVPRMDRSISYSGRELAPLRKADAARKGRAGWRAGAIASGLILPFVVLFFAVMMLIFGPGIPLVATALIATLPVAGFLAYALGRAGARGREIAPAIDAAWMAAATDIAQQTRGPLTAADLARKLGIEEPQAEELMALLDVNAAIGGAPYPTGARIAVEAPIASGPTQIAPVSAVGPTQIAPVSAAGPTQVVSRPMHGAPVSAVGPTQVAAEEEAAAIEQAAEAEAAQRKGSV